MHQLLAFISLMYVYMCYGKELSANDLHKVASKPLTIVVNGKSVQLEIKNKFESESDTHQFCLRYDLIQKDCLTLKNYVQELFQDNDKMIEDSKKNDVSECNNIIQELSQQKDILSQVIDQESNKVTQEENENMNDVDNSIMFKSSTKIDYSGKEGPTLEVTLDGVIIVLQAYIGENPYQAIKRFCIKNQFRTENCNQIKDSFLALYGIVDVNSNEEEEETSMWIDSQIWNSYIYPMLQVMLVCLVIIVYLMQWRDEMIEERDRGVN